MKVASETVSAPKFYERYFALVDVFLPQEVKKAEHIAEKPKADLGVPEPKVAPAAEKVEVICVQGFFLQAPSRRPVTFYRQECARQGLVLLHNTARTVFLRIFNVDIISLA